MIELSDQAAHLLRNVPLRAWLAVAAAMLAQRVLRRFGLWAYALFALPGTLAHEISHYVVALLLRARPRLPRLWPERTERGWRLGSVAFHAPWWRAGAIALAPLLLLPAALAWLMFLVAPANGAVLALHAWVAGTILDASLPSRTDLRIALPTLAVVAAVAAAALAWQTLSG